MASGVHHRWNAETLSRWWLRGRRLLAWVLAPILLYLVGREIDGQRLLQSLSSARPWPVLIGISLVGAKVVIGAWRWHALCLRAGVGQQRFGDNLSRYAASLAVGALGPGTLGSDVYRVAIGATRSRDLRSGTWVIVLEKLTAMMSCGLLIVGLAPWYGSRLAHTLLDGARPYLWAMVAAAAAAVLVLVALIARRRRLPAASPSKGARAHQVFVDPAGWIQALGLSLLIQVVGAIQGYLFLDALGHPLPLTAHLFVVPLTVLVLSLPITVAGIGVREGLFVLVYGAFGVPAEIALLTGFLFFASQSLGQAVGALSMLRPARGPRTATGAG